MNRKTAIQLEETEKLVNLGKALSSEVRMEILRMLREETLSVNEIATILHIPVSSAALHVKTLEAAGLILSEYQSGIRGAKKVCSLRLDMIDLVIVPPHEVIPDKQFMLISAPLGSYFDCSVEPTCGLVNEQGYIDTDDTPSVFYHPDRFTAQLLWFNRGYVEYRFPSSCLRIGRASSIEVSLELCSEAANYRNIWPSDITIWINGVEVLTYVSPGDFGGRRGKNNPAWWSDLYTQYGLLKNFKVDESGSYIDEIPASDVTLDDLHLYDKEYISFRIGIKKDAKNQGGINIFGEKFGDYSQDIVMRLNYVSNM